MDRDFEAVLPSPGEGVPENGDVADRGVAAEIDA